MNQLKEGLAIKHTDGDWYAEVLSIDYDNNEIRMRLHGIRGKWQENWNLAHTLVGLNNDEYSIINDNCNTNRC